jgi:hypothetical protein
MGELHNNNVLIDLTEVDDLFHISITMNNVGNNIFLEEQIISLDSKAS